MAIWSTATLNQVTTAFGPNGAAAALEVQAGAYLPGLGYGGTVTQATNRTTAVTLNTLMGVITTNTASLAAEAAATFTFNNTMAQAGDILMLGIQGGSNGGNTKVLQASTTAGVGYTITVANDNAAAGTAETGAVQIAFRILRIVTT